MHLNRLWCLGRFYLERLLAKFTQPKAISLIIDSDTILNACHVSCTFLILRDHIIADVVFQRSLLILILRRDVLLHLNCIAVTHAVWLLLLYQVSEPLTCLILVKIVLSHIVIILIDLGGHFDLCCPVHLGSIHSFKIMNGPIVLYFI